MSIDGVVASILTGKSWGDTETPFARDVLRFVNEETFGNVAWFKKAPDGTYGTNVQTGGGMCTVLDGMPSEEALAVAYWNLYFKSVEYTARRYASLWHAIFSRRRRFESRARLERWQAWRAEHEAEFARGGS